MSGFRHILRLISMFSMKRKPSLAAVGAAEGRPLVLGVPYVYEDAAVPAIEAMLYGLGLYVFGMLPVQPLAVSRAELDPPVCRFRHPHQLAAFQAAEGTQGFFFPRRTAVVVDAVPVRITAAVGAAVFLRDSVRFKFFAANGTYGFPFHRQPMDSLASTRSARRAKQFRARKKDSIHLCCLKNMVSPEYTNPPKDGAEKERTNSPSRVIDTPKHV